MYKLELKSSHELVETVNVADIESIFYCKPTDPDILTILMTNGKRLYCDEVCPMQEEPVSEFMNIESMIESYKERLISQANGVKNSPLIDMCLASYKHGINETLDTLNLFNVQRTVKNWKEPVSDELEKAANNAVIALVPSFGQKYSDGSYVSSCRDCFKREELLELFKAGAKWQEEQDKETIELAEDHAMLAGMEKMKEQMMAKAIDGVVTFDYYGDDNKTYGCVAHDSFCLEDFGLKDRDKVKVIVIKED